MDAGYDLFDDLLSRGAHPAAFRRPLVAIGTTWLLVAAVALVVIPAARADGAAVVRTALTALVASAWLWTWLQLGERLRVWLRSHSELGDGKRILAYMVAMTAYPLLSLAVLFVVI